MLPWCHDEKEETVHTEYIRFLAHMDSKQSSKATKHAIMAASSLLRANRVVKFDKNKGHNDATKSAEKPQRRVAWHSEQEQH